MKWGLHLYEGNYSLDLQLWAIGRDHVNNIKVICILLHIHKSLYLDNNYCHPIPVIRNLNPILQIISFKISMMIKLMYSHSREKNCGCQSLGMSVLQDSWTKILFVVCVISSDHPCSYVKINSFNEISSPGVRAARSKC